MPRLINPNHVPPDSAAVAMGKAQKAALLAWCTSRASDATIDYADLRAQFPGATGGLSDAQIADALAAAGIRSIP